ncbi:MAG: DUF4900 domain-containing protein [Candidatus Aegiribacteria sp.]|nr:DUF4900 domain-containing protein [Candidatus Aegiribacteria sp.]
MKRGRTGEKGAVLAITMVLAVVLFILFTAVFVLFNANIDSYRNTSDRIQAMATAEAGANIALHELALGNGAPAETAPYSLPGDSAQWMSIQGGDGKARVIIDPYDGNTIPNSIGAVEIRSRGLCGNVTRDVVIRASPDYPSRYALLMNRSISQGFFVDGTFIDGPVHSNGSIGFSSLSSDSTDDPYVAAISTSLEDFYFADAGYSDVPHPANSNIWIRPYRHHARGSPYWETEADSIDFHAISQWFRQLQNEAALQGTMILGTGRIILKDDMLLFKNGIDSPVDTIDLTGKEIVYIQCGGGRVYLKTSGSPDNAITLVSTGPIFVAGSIDKPRHDDSGPLGIVSLADIIIAEDPDLSGDEDWPYPWSIETDQHLQIRAVVAAPNGCLRAQNPGMPDPGMRFTIYGGLILNHFGLTGMGGKGYELAIAWNQALTRMHPPCFPDLNRWVISSWEQDRDYGELSIDDNLF